MIKPELLDNEKERLNALKEYSILDTIPEKEYDDITFLASFICNTPISLISLIDDKRQWFKSHHGTEDEYTPKEVSFCAHAINDQDNILIVPDSRKDERFHDNPLVIGAPNVIFYAGIPLVNPEGYPLGTLCVIDNNPRELNDNQIRALEALSNQLMKLFELRRNSMALRNRNSELKYQNKGLNEFVRVAAHDIKSPMSNITMIADLLLDKYSDNMVYEGKELINHIHISAKKLIQLIDGILQYSRDSSFILKNRESINVKAIIEEVIYLLDARKKAEFSVEVKDDVQVFANKTVMQQVFVNFISNSIRYNNKRKPEIIIKVTEEQQLLKVNIIDNGPGIKDEDKSRIFDLFATTSNTDKDGFRGSGIGLATIKSLVEGMGGNISVKSEFGKGANFEFTIRK